MAPYKIVFRNQAAPTSRHGWYESQTGGPVSPSTTMPHVANPGAPAQSDVAHLKPPGESTDSSESVLELDHAIGYTSTARNGIVLHPDGKHYIVVSGACLVINNLEDPREQAFLSGHSQTITCIDVSRSGSWIASGQQGVESDVVVWNYATKSVKYRFEEHQFGIAAVCFSWDERFLVTVGSVSSGRVIVWDMDSGYIVGASPVAPTPFYHIAWGGRVKDIKRRPTLDCQFATCAKDESYIHMWKLTPSTGQLSFEMLRTGSFKRIYSAIQFSIDAEYLFAGSTTGDVSVFYVRNSGLCTTFRACSGGVQSLVSTAAFDVLVGGGDCTISKFHGDDPKHFTQSHRSQLSGSISTIALSPDDREAIVGTSVGDAYRMRIANPSQHLLLSQSHSGCVHAVAFPRNVSDCFASCSDDGTIKVWDISDYSLICSGSAESHVSSSLAISEECIISGWEDGKIRSMETSTGDRLWRINNAHNSGISALCLSPNEKFLVSGSQEGDVRVWEIRKRELLCHLKEHTGHVANLAIYKDNRRAITCSRDRSILCWDLQTELRISCHRQNMGGINDISINHDESLIVSVGQEKRVTFWDLRLPQAAALIELDSEGRSIDINSAGNLFAVGDDKTYAKLFDIRTMRLLSTGVGHSRSLTCVRFSPDGKQLVSSSQGGNIFIWNAFQL